MSFFEIIEQIKKSAEKSEIIKLISLAESKREFSCSTHADFEASRLEETIKEFLFNLRMKPVLAEFLIYELRHGELRTLFNFLEPYRKKIGLSLPLPAETLLIEIMKSRGFSGSCFDLEISDVKKIFSSSLSPEFLISIARKPNIYTTTGFGRNVEILENLSKFWAGGSYADVAGSCGAAAMEIKKLAGFKSAVSADIMSEDDAFAVPTIVDFYKKERVVFGEDIKKKIRKEVDFIWGFDARAESFKEFKESMKYSPVVFGVHNLLQYYTDKEAIIKNVVDGVGEAGYLWISSSGNPYNFIIEFDNGIVRKIIHD